MPFRNATHRYHFKYSLSKVPQIKKISLRKKYLKKLILLKNIILHLTIPMKKGWGSKIMDMLNKICWWISINNFFIVFWRKLYGIHYDNKNPIFTKLSTTNKKKLTDWIGRSCHHQELQSTKYYNIMYHLDLTPKPNELIISSVTKPRHEIHVLNDETSIRF
jgi:hypothetical protein